MQGWRFSSGAGLLAAAVLALTPLLGAGPTVAAQESPLPVTATFSILGDLVQQVGGDAVDVLVLVETNTDAHTFEPTPEDVATLSEAAVIFENGLGFEPWLDQLVESSETEAPVVTVTEGVVPRAMEDGHDDGDAHEEEDVHEHGEVDPHVWHDVANAMVMVEAIRDALIAADPDQAAIYSANADAYLTTLQELDAWVVEETGTLPSDRRQLVTSHDTFGYFADRYGFEVIGAAQPLSTEAGEPSAGEIADLLAAIEEAEVPAIFADNVANPALMEQIAAEAGVNLAPPLYSDALGEPGSPGEDYVSMMRYNVTTIVDALGA